MKNIFVVLLMFCIVSCVGGTGGKKKKSKLNFENNNKKQEKLLSDQTKNNDNNKDNIDFDEKSSSKLINSDSSFDKNEHRLKSINKYKDTVHEIVKKRCFFCHGENKIRSPFFAVKNVEASFNSVLNTGKVSKESPIQSRLVQRLIKDKHNCWSDCKKNSEEMLLAINEWLKVENIKLKKIDSPSNSNTSPTKLEGKSFVTGELTFDQAEVRIPEMENGTIVFNAEDGELLGRMTVKKHSKAIGSSYISGLDLKQHPDSEGMRRGVNQVSCNTNLSGKLKDKINGPFRVTESKRHVNQNGPLSYSVMLSGYLIRPSKINQYTNMLLSNDFSRLDEVIIKDGNPIYKEGTNEIIGFEGRPIRINFHRVLPKFLKYDDYFQYDSRTRRTKVKYLDQNLFKDNEGLYFKPEAREIRRNISDNDKKKIFFKSYKDMMHRLFFYSGNRRRNLRQRIPWARLTTYEKAMKLTFQYASGQGDIDNIDKRVHYYVDPFTRNLQNFSVRRYDANNNRIRSEEKFFRMTSSESVPVNLSSIYVGKRSTGEYRDLSIKGFSTTVYKYFREDNNRCSTCHTNGNNGAPKYLDPIPDNSWELFKSRKLVNLEFPNNSKLIQKMNLKHNCGNACSSYKREILNAINAWKKEENIIATRLQSKNSKTHISLTEEERTPARAKYHFLVKESGNYNIWFKTLTERNSRHDTYVVIKDSFGNEIIPRSNNSNMKSCYNYRFPSSNEWIWNTAGLDDETKRVSWQLKANNKYSIELFEHIAGAKIDMLAISKNSEFDPSSNIIDEGVISSVNPRILKYDISKAIGKRGFFEIEIKDKNSESMTFSNPKFKVEGLNVYLKGLKLKVDRAYEFSNATFNDLDLISDNSNSLTRSTLFALKVGGKAEDKYSFEFKELSGTNAPATIKNKDIAKPFVGRKCKRLDLFVKTVKPIFSEFRLAEKREIERFAERFPNRNRTDNFRLRTYKCISCHTADHIYFKMRNFLQKSDEAFCEQALSRVDFENPRRSLILRGVNGTHTHPKLHFVSSGKMNNDKTNYIRSRVDGNDYIERTFLSGKFPIYTSQEVRIDSGLSDEDKSFLRRSIGKNKKIKYRRFNDPLNFKLYEEVMTEGDFSIPKNPGRGDNLYDIVYPQDFIGQTSEEKKEFEAFDSNDYPLYVDKTKDFDDYEAAKAKYRNAVLKWIEEERK